MPKKIKISAPSWAEPAQKSRSRVRGSHGLAVREPGVRRPVNRIPKTLANRIYEQSVLRTPGVAAGFDDANETIENWKKSL